MITLGFGVLFLEIGRWVRTATREKYEPIINIEKKCKYMYSVSYLPIITIVAFRE